MSSWRFYMFFISSALWSWNQTTGAEMYNALFINQENNKLVEMSKSENTTKCPDCVSACPASPEFNDEQFLNHHVSVTKNALFLRNVYKDGNTTDIKVKICENPILPSIIWENELNVYGIGYELYLEEGKSDLKCEDDYANFKEVINAVPNLKREQFLNNDFIETYKDGIFTKFQIMNEQHRKFVFYWSQIFSVVESFSKRHRTIVFAKDTINNYFLGKETTAHCESFLLGYRNQMIQSRNSTTDLVQDQTNTEEATSEQPIENRLEKTQILPMHMFHTFSARLATCMYINMAYIWSSIAQNQIKNIDLYLYSIYRLWPNEISIFFGVNSRSSMIKFNDPEENKIFRDYPIPEVIFRVVEYKLRTESYYVVVVIHNDLNPIPWNRRICLTSVESWHQIENNSEDIAKPGLSYTCILTEKVYDKLGIDPKMLTGQWYDLKLNEFPTLDSNEEIVRENVLQKVYDEFQRIKQ